MLHADRVPTSAQLVTLYDAVGWTTYTRDPATLHAAVAGSSYVVTAWDGDDLLGLARAVSDDASVCYLQDVLVDPDRRRTGLGRALVHAVLARYPHVRQLVLLTDDEPAQAAFYNALGFRQVGVGELSTLRSFVRVAEPRT